MRIIGCSGGLANQMLSYIFKIYMEHVTDEEYLIDDSNHHERSSHNGFELDKIFPNIKMKLLKDVLDENVYKMAYQYLNNGNTKDIGLRKIGLSKTLLVSRPGMGGSRKYKCAYLAVDPKLFIEYSGNPPSISYFENIYYQYFFAHKEMIPIIKEQMLLEFEFKPLIDDQNKEYLKKIKTTISIGVHIRRGDFVDLKWDIPADMFANAIKSLKDKISTNNNEITFFIFSNEISWCKNNSKELGLSKEDEVVFVEGNDVDAKNYIDMQLMSNCNYLVSNIRSTFSELAGLISRDLVEHIRLK